MSGLTVAYVTAGGAGMYCGSCMRDNTLVATARQFGCNPILIPTFTPITTDEGDVSIDRVFLGGINVYIEQRWPLLRHLPGPVRRALDSPRLLKWISKLALQTRTSDDGALAASLLRGEYGHQKDEIDDLVRWLAHDLKPDVVNLTNLLISGFVPAFKKQRDVPVLVTLQGDDVFLDALPERDRKRVIAEMRNVAKHIDGFVVFSQYYQDFMSELLDIPADRFHRVPLGLSEPEKFVWSEKAERDDPTLGFLARICPEKGFHQLVDAFLLLRRMPGMERVRLHAAGWLGGSNRDFFEAQLKKITAAGAADAFEHVEIPDRDSKIRFLHGIDLLSVPTVYREPKGLYILESLAAGVPVVVPEHGAFPELLATTGGGRLVPPGDVPTLAAVLRDLLQDDAERARLAAEGQNRVLAGLGADSAARRTLEVWQHFANGAV